MLLLWVGAVGQQVLGMTTLRREIWQAEHTTFSVHLGILAPDPGLATIPVRFTETQSEADRESLLAGDLPALERRPDIYIVMVETWRADTVTPEIAPFLSRFRAEECQQFETTFSSSNCTPVSWFTFFHSRVGIHWKEVVREREDRGRIARRVPGPAPRQAWLPVQRARRLRPWLPGDGRGQFRRRPQVRRHVPRQSHASARHQHPAARNHHRRRPERAAPRLASRRPSPLPLFDSPHYNYYWPSDNFEPLHRDCIGNPTFPANPSPEHVREIVKRYENSIHWIDHQVEQLVAFLKAEGRYDDAIIILTGDHGEDFQEDGTWYHCSNLKRPQTEVPLMIKWPAWLGPDRQPAQSQASHLDVMPSLLDALGMDERFFEGLAGRSLLRPQSGGTILSTQWAGNSRIGICFVRDGVKANFRANRLWSGNVPETLYFMGYTDLADQPLDPLELRGDHSHVEALRERYPELTKRFFRTFGTP